LLRSVTNCQVIFWRLSGVYEIIMKKVNTDESKTPEVLPKVKLYKVKVINIFYKIKVEAIR